MSLQTRLSALITAIGTDIKALQARTPTILGDVTSLSNTSQPTKAVEWWNTGDGTLIAKLAALTKIENAVILNRTELWARVSSRTNDVTVDKMILDSNGLSMLVPPLVTALPTTGPGTNSAVADGQECYYLADSGGTNGGPVIWHLKYRASDSKWYYVGGPPLSTQVLTDESTTSATYTNLATTGPSITIPLAGDYLVSIGGELYSGVASGAAMSYAIGGTAAADAEWIRGYQSSGDTVVSGWREKRHTGLTANTALVAKYKRSSGTGTPHFTNRHMQVRPIRVS